MSEVRILTGPDGARAATGDVVIIDVIRAFTTAAYAFAAGIGEIELVATVEEALARPGFRMGEVGGKLIPGFDHNNSPSQLAGKRLSGCAVQRTGSGTQGAVLATRARSLWLGSLRWPPRPPGRWPEATRSRWWRWALPANRRMRRTWPVRS